MFIRKCRSDPTPVGVTALHIQAAEFLKKNIQQKKLGDSGRNGTQLEGTFIGTAAENDLSQSGTR